MEPVRFGEVWKTCPIIDVCALPAVCCYNCWKYQRIVFIEREAKREQDKTRFQEAPRNLGLVSESQRL